MQTTVHPFEAAGLGKAPFTCFAVERGAEMSSCDYCSTAIRYQCWIRSADGRTFKVGNDCVAKTLDGGLNDETEKRLKGLREESKQAKRRESTKSAKLSFLESNPGLAELLEIDHPVIAGMKANLARFGSLSIKQIAYARTLAERQQQESRPEEKPVIPPIIQAERVAIAGRIVSAKSKDTQFGVSFKMLVLLPNGQKLWGSIPDAIFRETQRSIQGLKGVEIEFIANVSPSNDDQAFGFFARPTKATVLSMPLEY